MFMLRNKYFITNKPNFRAAALELREDRVILQAADIKKTPASEYVRFNRVAD